MSNGQAALELVMRTIVDALVDNPDSVKYSFTGTEATSNIEIAPSKDDIGKVIGRAGKTAESLRHIAASIGGKHGIKAFVSVQEQK
jgi:predicted RNA-binding protein YlqC (UPF0109 family)